MEKHDMLKDKEKFCRILLHIALICGIVILTAGILDWFNPYMNFSGQIRPVEIAQVCDLLVLTFAAGQQKIEKNQSNRSSHYSKGK